MLSGIRSPVKLGSFYSDEFSAKESLSSMVPCIIIQICTQIYCSYSFFFSTDLSLTFVIYSGSSRDCVHHVLISLQFET